MRGDPLEPLLPAAGCVASAARESDRLSMTRANSRSRSYASPPRSWQLHGKRRFWSDGRIAECPRLQQIGRIA